MQTRSAYRWQIVAMLWFVCFFNYADRQAIFSVFPALKTEFGLSDLQLGIVGASFMWVYALFGPIAGWMGDRFSRKALILGGLIFWSVITAATALAHTYSALIVCRALGGLGEAFYFPASMSLISDYHGEATRSRAMSIHQSAVYAGSIAGGVISGYMAQQFGWQSSFLLLGAAGVALGFVLLGFLREPARAQPALATQGVEEIGRSLAEVFASRVVVIVIAAFICANCVAAIFLTWLPSFLYQKFHLSLSMAGLNGTAYLQIASVLGVLSGGLLADSLSRRHRSGRMMTQAIGLAGGIPFLILTGWAPTIPVALAAMAGFGYCKGIYDSNIFASLYDVVTPQRRAVAAGIMNSLGWLGGSIGPVAVAAAAAHFGMSASISASALVYALAASLLAAGIWRVRSGREPEPDYLGTSAREMRT